MKTSLAAFMERAYKINVMCEGEACKDREHLQEHEAKCADTSVVAADSTPRLLCYSESGRTRTRDEGINWV